MISKHKEQHYKILSYLKRKFSSEPSNMNGDSVQFEIVLNRLTSSAKSGKKSFHNCLF